MKTQINPVQETDTTSELSELALTSDYYQHKANECRELVDSLTDWETVPESNLDFSVGGQSVASFRIGPAENVFLQTVLMSLSAYYQRKCGELRSKIDSNNSQGSSIQ